MLVTSCLYARAIGKARSQIQLCCKSSLRRKRPQAFSKNLPSLEAAFARWGRDRVAVGKVNIVKAPGRAARLVIDNSVCNTNQNCTVPEQFSLPSLQDIQAAYPLREDSEPVAGFSLDVKGAHKTALVRESDRGLLGLRQQERLFFYRVCPFGATFSSHWFSRLSGFFTRCLYLLIWISHVLMLYVDDLLLWQNEKVLPLSAALILAFCSCFRIPLSWRKLQLGPAITWIGWEINFGAGCFTLPEAKRIKLLLQLQECLRHRLVSRKQLDRLLGLLQWILHGFPALRPWLCSLYDDMHRPLGTNVSVSPTSWPGLHAFLDESLRFTDNPPGTGINAGSTLLSARHRSLQRKADLALVPVSTKRIWLRVADPTSSKRRLSQASRETLEFFTHLAAAEWRPRPLRPAPASEVTSAADAFGKANDCGVGGWLRLPSDKLIWFSHRYTVHDFTALGIPMQADANLDISSYETLAQCFLLLAFWKSQGSGRLAITLPTLSDNSGAESVCNKLYTSKVPLNLFVRKLSMWSSITGITLDCSHIAGEKNDDADLLSRWDGTSPLPAHFVPADRIELSLREFWDVRFEAMLGATRSSEIAQSVLDEVGDGLFAELDFVQEARHAELFQSLYGAKCPDVVVPEVVWSRTSTRVLTTTWLHGRKPRDLSAQEKLRLVNLAGPCLSLQLMDAGFVHCDPHEGNMMLLEDGRLGLIDFGLVAQMTAVHQESMASAILSLLAEDYKGLVPCFRGMGILSSEREDDEDLKRPGEEQPFAIALEEDGMGVDRRRAFGQLYEELSNLAFRYYFTLPSYYVLVMRSFVTLEGIAFAADPDFNMYTTSSPFALRRLLMPRTTTGRKLLEERLVERQESGLRLRLLSLLQGRLMYGKRSKQDATGTVGTVSRTVMEVLLTVPHGQALRRVLATLDSVSLIEDLTAPATAPLRRVAAKARGSCASEHGCSLGRCQHVSPAVRRDKLLPSQVSSTVAEADNAETSAASGQNQAAAGCEVCFPALLRTCATCIALEAKMKFHLPSGSASASPTVKLAVASCRTAFVSPAERLEAPLSLSREVASIEK
eukprot:s4935_g3.t7